MNIVAKTLQVLCNFQCLFLKFRFFFPLKNFQSQHVLNICIFIENTSVGLFETNKKTKLSY